MRFRTTVALEGRTATGLHVPPEVYAALGPRKRIPVTVTIGGHSYRSTVTPYNGAVLIPLSADNRAAAGVAAGDEVDVDVEVDDAPREVDVPDDLQAALTAAGAHERFAALSYSAQNGHVLQVVGAKTDATRERRIAKVVGALTAG
jgi:hypothetical protein